MFALALAAAQAGKTRSGHSVRAGPAAAGGASPHFERGFSLGEPDKMGAAGARGGPGTAPPPPDSWGQVAGRCAEPRRWEPAPRGAPTFADKKHPGGGQPELRAGVAFVPHPCLLGETSDRTCLVRTGRHLGPHRQEAGSPAVQEPPRGRHRRHPGPGPSGSRARPPFSSRSLCQASIPCNR